MAATLIHSYVHDGSNTGVYKISTSASLSTSSYYYLNGLPLSPFVSNVSTTIINADGNGSGGLLVVLNASASTILIGERKTTTTTVWNVGEAGAPTGGNRRAPFAIFLWSLSGTISVSNFDQVTNYWYNTSFLNGGIDFGTYGAPYVWRNYGAGSSSANRGLFASGLYLTRNNSLNYLSEDGFFPSSSYLSITALTDRYLQGAVGSAVAASIPKRLLLNRFFTYVPDTYDYGRVNTNYFCEFFSGTTPLTITRSTNDASSYILSTTSSSGFSFNDPAVSSPHLVSSSQQLRLRNISATSIIELQGGGGGGGATTDFSFVNPGGGAGGGGGAGSYIMFYWSLPQSGTETYSLTRGGYGSQGYDPHLSSVGINGSSGGNSVFNFGDCTITAVGGGGGKGSTGSNNFGDGGAGGVESFVRGSYNSRLKRLSSINGQAGTSAKTIPISAGGSGTINLEVGRAAIKSTMNLSYSQTAEFTGQAISTFSIGRSAELSTVYVGGVGGNSLENNYSQNGRPSYIYPPTQSSDPTAANAGELGGGGGGGVMYRNSLFGRWLGVANRGGNGFARMYFSPLSLGLGKGPIEYVIENK